MKVRLILLAVFAISLGACKKQNSNSSTPFVYFESLTPNSVTASSPKDTVFISFKVVDGDGDLGNDPTSGNHDVYLIDTRVNQANPYFFPSIPSDLQNAKDGITAHCTVKVIAALFLQKRNDTAHLLADTVVYKIYVKDRAGHNSDTITAPPIYLY
ncbi:MAG: hypothetical protein JST70_15520 [Bacteroidetes bacterium]|nr:hypothetical protein [Bacteroidota bacterium]